MKTEAEKDSKPDQLSAYAEKIGGMGNVLIALSGLSYALGFIIVNIYLATMYRIYSFEIFNARYVYSGASFLLLCLLAYFGASFLSSKMEHIRNKSRFQKILEFVGWFGVVHGLYLASFMSIVLIVESRKIDSIPSLFSNYPIAPWLALAMLAFYAQIHFFKNRNWEKLPHQVPFPSSVLTNIIFLAAVYGMYYYFFLPPSLGGGLPTPITLIVDKDKIEVAQQLLPVTSQNPSVAVYLIEQNTDSLYILVESQNTSASANTLRAIQVDKSIIVGIVYPNKVNLSKWLEKESVGLTLTPSPTMTPVVTSTP